MKTLRAEYTKHPDSFSTTFCLGQDVFYVVKAFLVRKPIVRKGDSESFLDLHKTRGVRAKPAIPYCASRSTNETGRLRAMIRVPVPFYCPDRWLQKPCNKLPAPPHPTLPTTLQAVVDSMNTLHLGSLTLRSTTLRLYSRIPLFLPVVPHVEPHI